MAASIEMNEGASGGRTKFLVGGLIILAAVVYLIVTATMGNQQYFRTVDELVVGGDEMVGQAVRVSGAVIGTETPGESVARLKSALAPHASKASVS